MSPPPFRDLAPEIDARNDGDDPVPITPPLHTPPTSRFSLEDKPVKVERVEAAFSGYTRDLKNSLSECTQRFASQEPHEHACVAKDGCQAIRLPLETGVRSPGP